MPGRARAHGLLAAAPLLLLPDALALLVGGGGLRLGVLEELQLLLELDLLRLRLGERRLGGGLRGLRDDEGLLGGDAELLALGPGDLGLPGERGRGVLLLLRAVVDARGALDHLLHAAELREQRLGRRGVARVEEEVHADVAAAGAVELRGDLAGVLLGGRGLGGGGIGLRLDLVRRA